MANISARVALLVAALLPSPVLAAAGGAAGEAWSRDTKG